MLSKIKKNLWIILRTGVFILLILSLFDIRIHRVNKKDDTVFLVDRSLSTAESKESIEKYINEQIQKKDKKSLTEVISFGENAMTDMPLTDKKEKFAFNTNVNPDFTNIENGIRFALDSFPQDVNKNLVLFTDGIENLESYQQVEEKLKEENVNLFIYPLKRADKNDCQLKSMKVPAKIYNNEEFQLSVEIYSNYGTTADFHLYGDEKEILNKRIEIKKGLNSLKYDISPEDSGWKSLKGEIKADGDTNSYNNVFTIGLNPAGSPKILILGTKEDTKNVTNLLNSIGIQISRYTPKEVNGSVDYLVQFDEIILTNVSHDDISEELEKNLEYCVKKEGTGLLVIGGENTFSMGNYKDTLLESMLPVKSQIKGNEKKPNSGIVLAIDTSGSMEDETGGVKKIEIAKEAAISSLDILDDNDWAGVIGFSDRTEWVVPYGKIKDKKNIEESIGKLKAQGGTLIMPSLKESIKSLSSGNTKINHIILLSDGEGEKEGYEDILKEMEEKEITLSTIAVGKDSDEKFLKYLSEETKGRSYYVEDPADIPKIFAKETYMATRKYINERAFYPQLVNSSGIINKNFLPKMKGYISTSLKDRANLILKTDLDEPLLAEWQYGSGNVLVWTSDLSGKWSKDWIEWEGFEKNWSNIIDYLLSQRNSGEDHIEIIQKSGNADIYVDTEKNGEKVDISVTEPDGKNYELAMKQYEKGKFNQNIILNKKGSYIVNLKVSNEDGSNSLYTRVLYLDYSPEYFLEEEKDKNLELMSKYTVINGETEIFSLPIKDKSYSDINMNYIFLPLAGILFVSDLWVRKKFGGN